MPPSRPIPLFFLLNYPVSFLLSLKFFVNTSHDAGAGALLFSAVVQITYALIYLLPAMALSHLTARLAGEKSHITATVTVFTTTFSMFYLYCDSFIYGLYGFHLNGFVFNLLTTPGGIESLGGGVQTSVSFALYTLGFFAGEILLYVLCQRYASRLQPICRRLLPGPRILVTLFLLLTVGERITYGWASAFSNTAIVSSAAAYPLYQPLTFRSTLTKWGIDVPREISVGDQNTRFDLNYPKRPLELAPVEKPHNIVWLVAESWRWDMLDPDIMPATWAFAQRANRFTRHYSGGNGTRMGMFSMFYGLHGAYWFSMLQERRPPVLMEAVRQQGYQWSFYTSARFTYPEFDKTLFAGVPPEHLHDDNEGIGVSWKMDRRNVDRLLSYIDSRDPQKPFMTFMFFESPHASYYFPPENVIRPEYLPDFDYTKMDLKRDIGLIKNRYINACNHLDSQFARIIRHLEERDLLDSTIVVMVGDHGEEFMEKGRWGHNSEFHEEQLRTPLVLWLPELGGQVIERKTSHIDLVPTLASYLGIRNTPADFTLGKNLLGHHEHEFLVVSDWASVGIIDDQFKVRMPTTGAGLNRNRVTDLNDRPRDPQEFFGSRQDRVVRLMQELGEFRVKTRSH